MATLTLTVPTQYAGAAHDYAVVADYVMNPDNFTANDNGAGYAGISNFTMSADFKTMYITNVIIGTTGTRTYQVKDNTVGAVVTSNLASFSVVLPNYDTYTISDGTNTASLKVHVGHPVTISGPVHSTT